MIKRKQSKKEFYPNGVNSGKRAILFNLQITSSNSMKSISLSQKVLAVAFLEDCKKTVQEWLTELQS